MLINLSDVLMQEEGREGGEVCGYQIRTRLLAGEVPPAVGLTRGVVVVGETSVFGAAAFLTALTGLAGSRTSLPVMNMKRRSCQGGEDMAMFVAV